jgi:hypothetical protein
MSAVVVLSPVIIASWPAITVAAVGAAASMGYAVRSRAVGSETKLVACAEAEVAEAEAVGSELSASQMLIMEREGVSLEIRQDAGGRCRVCARGEGRSKRELQKLADEAAGRIVQQFIYHKLLTELKSRSGEIVRQERLADDSVRVHVRL